MDKPRIGLALGSGSARGWAHIGILRALIDAGIEPAIVTGSSIGALVGAAYASNNLDALEEWVRGMTWWDVVRYMDVRVAGGGFIQGDRLMKVFRGRVKDVPIESLPVSFTAVTTDLATGQERWLQSGSLIEAVRASIALPGLFTPMRVDGQWLMDGGLVNPVPVSACRALGADAVIAVNLNGDIVGKHLGKQPGGLTRAEEQDLFAQFKVRLNDGLAMFGLKPEAEPEPGAPGLFEVIAGSLNIMQDRITRSRMAGDPPEAVVAPPLSGIGLLEFDRADEAIAEGRRCAEEAMPRLCKLAGLED
ncbi:MAG TPA: patatin-like phospholipase RssA [Gammaproteobacteria bacterium]|nr:patatin-like phospholipase RssA [Gammaproteobacteria bacterium]